MSNKKFQLRNTRAEVTSCNQFTVYSLFLGRQKSLISISLLKHIFSWLLITEVSWNLPHIQDWASERSGLAGVYDFVLVSVFNFWLALNHNIFLLFFAWLSCIFPSFQGSCGYSVFFAAEKLHRIIWSEFCVTSNLFCPPNPFFPSACFFLSWR